MCTEEKRGKKRKREDGTDEFVGEFEMAGVTWQHDQEAVHRRHRAAVLELLAAEEPDLVADGDVRFDGLHGHDDGFSQVLIYSVAVGKKSKK